MISTTGARASYSGDGSSAVFNYQYEFHADADLTVNIWNSARIVATSLKTLNVDYTISGTKDAQSRYTTGANVIFNSTPATGDYVIITSAINPTNPFGLKQNQTIPNAELTKALDRLTIIEQRLNDVIGRSIRLPDAYPLTFDAKLPDRLPKNAPIIVSSSGQSISVGVVAFNGSTAATYFGILPIANGGTGLDLSALNGILYAPGDNTTLSRINFAGEGKVLISHGSSAPTFDTFSATVVNSGLLAVGFGGTGTGTSYIQYGVVFASSATQMANTPAGGGDQPLIGNPNAAPSFQALNVASNSSVTGIMAQSHGGTGSASSFPQYAIIYQGGVSSYASVPSAAEGRILTSHGSSAPTFDAMSIALINSGILSVAFGGTGTGSGYIQYGVVFASSATQMSNTVAGGTDQPLIGNGGAAPSFQALNVASNSSVTGIMAQSHGGTGSASSFPQYAVVFQSGAGSYGGVPSAADGRVLTAHGSSAPSFDVSVASNTPKTRILISTGSTTTLASDNIVFFAGPSATFTLHTPVGNKDQVMQIMHNGSSHITNAYTVTAPAGTGFAGNSGVTGSSFTFYTIGEKATLVSDNTNWVFLEHHAETSWSAPASFSIGTGGSTLMTVGSATIPKNAFSWRRVGAHLHGDYFLRKSASGTGTSGAGDYLFPTPAGVLIDTTVAQGDTINYGAGSALRNSKVGDGMAFNYTGGTALICYASVWDASSVTMNGITDAGAIGTVSGAQYGFALANSMAYMLKVVLPISGWLP